MSALPDSRARFSGLVISSGIDPTASQNPSGMGMFAIILPVETQYAAADAARKASSMASGGASSIS